jgi:hypothetical protein
LEWDLSSRYGSETFVESYNFDPAAAAAGSSLIAAAFSFFSTVLFLEPLRSHQDWLTKEGFFAARSVAATPAPTNIDIIKGERLKSFSVADELLKWAKLLDDGLVSQEEFDEVRKKLLQRS